MPELNQTVHELIDDLERAYDGDPWHGPSLATVLNGVDAQRAAARPIARAHSIWELVLHLTSWTREVARRLRGASPAAPLEGDWPAVPQAASDDEWKRALAGLAAANRDLVAAVGDCSPEQLERRVGNTRDPALGSGQTYGAMVRGLAQHHAYHGGQIILLRRASEFGSSPPSA
jgi:uncharacterized damage-inducible protein DinB